MARAPKKPTGVETLTHSEATRTNIPTAEYGSVMGEDERNPVRLAYERRNRDLDPQLVWRGKDEQDWSDLIVHAPPLYIQEKVHPKALVDDLLRQSKKRAEASRAEDDTPDLFADFNGLDNPQQKTEFYQHRQHWSNRMILGDSLQVMASLAEREGLRGQVQCIYLDPPYGIKFNSNFQWSTTSRDVKDGNAAHITREPEQVKAFRDTWRDGIHSYLTYLRDRLTVARDLLSDSGSIFVQIGDENVHRVRALMDEVFGEDNFVSQIQIKKSGGATSEYLAGVTDFVIWYSKRRSILKYRNTYVDRDPEGIGGGYRLFSTDDGLYRSASDIELRAGIKNTEGKLLQLITLTSQRQGRDTSVDSAMGFPIVFEGKSYLPARGRGWTTSQTGISRLEYANRIALSGKNLRYRRYFDDFAVLPINDFWSDTQSGSSMDKLYVVQTNERIVQRCILMTTDPGDLVLDPTCGSGTTAYVAEQWGRRWITVDTSRVALALARARIMGARYPYYLLADSPEGQRKLWEIAGKAPPSPSLRGEAEAIQQPPPGSPRGSAARDDGSVLSATYHDIRQGFVYERVPHITLKSIANNSEIDVIWERFQEVLEPLRTQLNAALGKAWQEWEIPRDAASGWSKQAQALHAEWWQQRIARQREIDASIAAKADFEYLYDKPYGDNGRIRVAGPFTVESLSPHRVLAVDHDDELIDGAAADGVREPSSGYLYEGAAPEHDFAAMILENLRTAGVQQAHKEDRIAFTHLEGWPGDYICAEGHYMEGSQEAGSAEGATGKPIRRKRAGIFIGPEFGTVSRPDLVAAAREAGDAGFDVLIACAFNYDAHSSEFEKLGRVPVLKARMNADLHMADELKNTGKGNLFVIFGEPDIDILDAGVSAEGEAQVQVKINGVDVFKPQTGEVEASGPDGIACWFIDTDYNEESFFVRHAYFLGANDPYKALKTTLKAEIDEEAWATLNSDMSRPFAKPESGRIAVKVINHLGDEVMKVFGVR